MPTIKIETLVHAPVERCFDAARDLDLHLTSMVKTGEKAVAGRTTGLIELDEEVTWEARHFGVRQRFTSRITLFDRPFHFQDTMMKGAFQSFVHDHWFQEVPDGTAMRDILAFRSPLGVLGAVVDTLVMTSYLKRLLTQRNNVVKQFLEAAA